MLYLFLKPVIYASDIMPIPGIPSLIGVLENNGINCQYINLNADIEVKNNKIVLKNIIFSSNNNIINVDIFGVLVNKINPVAFQMESINSKYCRLYITNSQISGNIINTKGIFIINKNYGR